MKTFTLVASILAYTAALVTAQGGPIQTCPFTSTHCAPIGGTVETITVYEQPFTSTSTATLDCDGCASATIITDNCFGVGPVVTSTTFVYENAQPTTTVAVCSPTDS